MTILDQAGRGQSARGLSHVQTLSSADLDAAAGVLGDGLDEIPLYAGILGDDDRPDVRAGLARVVLRPLIAAGRVLGAWDDGRLVGVLAWHAPGDVLSGHADADVDFLAAHLDVARRLMARLASPPLPSPDPDAVAVSLAAVAAHVRRRGLLHALMRPVETFCIEKNVPFVVWVGLPHLRDAYRDGWRLTQFDVRHVDATTTLYGLISSRPPFTPAL